MREHIACPDCGNAFSLDISQARTEILCPRCKNTFAYASESIPADEEIAPMEEEVDPSAETVNLSNAQARKGDAKMEEEVARPGMTIGNYEIVEEVARGAVGVVYKARQKNLDRIVALKILIAGQAASEEQIQRFRQEALAVAKLRHPNIVPVYDVGVYEGKHYIAMEYVDGRPLHQMMKIRRFTTKEALDIILKVADAIGHAHKHGIIHRDIKPANIMMDDSGRVQVMDFGLAKEIEADEQFTRSGTTMGTPNYMPIEQAQGDNKNIDERSDIYSIGAVLYEMLTGVPPFVAETNLKTILKVINEEPLPPRRRNPTIQKDLETICIKAMEKDKSRRYETVDAFVEDIDHFTHGEPIHARPPSTIYRLSKRIRRNIAVIGASAGTIVAAIVILLLWRVFFPLPPPPPPSDGSRGPVIEAPPAWKTALENADKLFQRGDAYAAARERYEEALKNADAKMAEDETVRARLNIAICMAYEAGLYSDVEIMPGQFDAVVKTLEEVKKEYGAKHPLAAQNVDIYLLHIRFRSDGIDLYAEAAALAQKYPDLKAEDIIRDFFAKLPAGPLLDMIRGEKSSVETLNQAAEHFLQNNDAERAAETFLLLAERYKAQADFDKAAEQLDRILKIPFDGNTDSAKYYERLVGIKRISLYPPADDFGKYDLAVRELLNNEWDPANPDYFLYDPEIAQLKVDWGRNVYARWRAQPDRTKDDFELFKVYKIFSECLKYTEPPAEGLAPVSGQQLSPEEFAKISRRLQWETIVVQASAQLIVVGYARGLPAGQVVREIQRAAAGLNPDFPGKISSYAAKAYIYSKQYPQAMRIAYEMLINYRSINDSVLRAADILAESQVLKGIEKDGDPKNIDMQELNNTLGVLGILESMRLKPGEAEMEGDIMLKALFSGMAAYNRRGFARTPDGAVKVDDKGQPIETPDGKEIRENVLYPWWDKIKGTLDTSGVASDSYVRRIQEIAAPAGRPQPTDFQRQAFDQAVTGEKDIYKKGEMQFARGMSLMVSKDPAEVQKGNAMLQEILKEDTLKEFWFTRFLEEYLKERPETTPPSSENT
jgi:serine/threonine protein kinase